VKVIITKAKRICWNRQAVNLSTWHATSARGFYEGRERAIVKRPLWTSLLNPH